MTEISYLIGDLIKVPGRQISFLRLIIITCLFLFTAHHGQVRADDDVNTLQDMLTFGPNVEYVIPDPEIPGRMYGVGIPVEYQNLPGNKVTVMRSDDYGVTWKDSGKGLPKMKNLYHLRLFARSQLKNGVLYCSCRDDDLRIYGAIYRSGDRGLTWEHVYTFEDKEISAIYEDQSGSYLIVGWRSYSSYESGMYRSLDGGKTWTESCILRTAATINRFYTHPSDQSNLFAISEIWDNYILKSTDSGVSWTSLQSGGSEMWNYEGVLDLAFHPENPDIIIAALKNHVCFPVMLKLTTDGGVTWTDFGPEPVAGSCCVYSIYWDTKDVNTIILLLKGHDSVIKTVDGGLTWKIQLQSYNFYPEIINGVNGQELIESPWEADTLYMNLYCMMKSKDMGSTWAPLYPVSDECFGYVCPENSNYMFYHNYKTGIFRSTDRGKTWQSAMTGLSYNPDPVFFTSSPVTLGTLYFESYLDGSATGGDVFSIMKTTNYGSQWTEMCRGEFQNIYKLYASIHHADTVFLIGQKDGDSTALFRSVDGGQTWQQIQIPDLGDVLDFSESPFDPSILYLLGHNNEKTVCFYLSEDSGITWSIKGKESGLDVTVNCNKGIIVPDPSIPGRLYAGGSRNMQYMWVSHDQGANWAKNEKDRGLFYRDMIKIQPDNSNIIYARGERSIDGGETWSEWGFLPGQVQIDTWNYDLIYDLRFMQKMLIKSVPPKLMMSGYGRTYLRKNTDSDLFLMSYASDLDTNDFVTGIELFYNGHNVGYSYDDEINPETGVFYEKLTANCDQEGTYLVEFKAKDRFGNLSRHLPYLTIQ